MRNRKRGISGPTKTLVGILVILFAVGNLGACIWSQPVSPPETAPAPTATLSPTVAPTTTAPPSATVSPSSTPTPSPGTLSVADVSFQMGKNFLVESLTALAETNTCLLYTSDAADDLLC